MRHVHAVAAAGPRLESVPPTSDPEFTLAQDRHHSARDIDECRQALTRLLACVAHAERAITSLEVAVSCGMPHLRVLNMVGHLKREGVLHASLIAGTPFNYYLIHSLTKAPMPRSGRPGGNSPAVPDRC